MKGNNQMKNYALLLILVVLFTGCVTMPDTIDEAYLVEKTPEQTAKLDKIAQNVIAKKKDGDEAKKNLAIAEQSVKVSEEMAAFLEREKSLLVQREKLYTLKRDDQKLSEVRSRLKENKQQRRGEKAHLAFTIAFRDDAQAIVELRQAELAVSVAELNYEKAKIAQAFILKGKEKAGKKETEAKEEGFFKGLMKKISGSDKKGVDVKKFEEYLNKQKDNLKEAKAQQEKTAEKLKKAEKKLDDSGYKGER
jgi:hypothetical protein